MRLIFCFILLFTSTAALAGKAPELSASEANTLLMEDKVVMVDVRSVQEWQQTGIASSALPITIHQNGGLNSFLDQLMLAINNDKQTPIALICASGVRSGKVQHFLLQQGFTNVTNVSEGMIGNWYTKGWIEQGLPVVPYTIQ